MKFAMMLLLASPLMLSAQTLPGDKALDDSMIRPGSWEVTMTFRRGEQSITAGTMTYRIVELPGDRWGYITQTTTQLGTATDTSIARRRTLEPISHRSHAVPRTLTLDYDARTVTGEYAAKGGESRAIRRTTEVPTFDAAMLDLILGALPLANGYKTRLPMYIEEQEGLVWFDVSVAGTANVGNEEGWDVRVATEKYNVAYIIGRKDRRMLAGRVEYPNGASMEITRRQVAGRGAAGHFPGLLIDAGVIP